MSLCSRETAYCHVDPFAAPGMRQKSLLFEIRVAVGLDVDDFFYFGKSLTIKVV